MKTIITEAGKHIMEQKAILDEQTKFYKNLYTKNPKVKFALVRSEEEPYLMEEDKLSCEGDLTEDELFDGLMTLRSNKCPGGDGLTNEFYRKFFKKLATPLKLMAHHAFENELLPLSTWRGIIFLLLKKSKDSRYVKNMRSLTLINGDYKIIAKALDNRLRTVLPKLIKSDQTGFMKGRRIGWNLRKLLDIIEYTRRANIPAVILSVDMEKCFDMISYSAIFGALKYFNFGVRFTRWVKLFYTDFQVCTQNFGYFSEYFSKTRSTNQGCIILPSIFLLISEILANKLRNNKLIKGIPINGTEFLLSQFADDMDLYLPFDKVVINEVLNTFSGIETNTGLKVSYDKTVLYHIGSIAKYECKSVYM